MLDERRGDDAEPARRTETVLVNGREHPLPRPPSVRGALTALGLDQRPVAVEVNGRLVRRAEHAGTPLEPGDRMEIVTFVGGG